MGGGAKGHVSDDFCFHNSNVGTANRIFNLTIQLKVNLKRRNSFAIYGLKDCEEIDMNSSVKMHVLMCLRNFDKELTICRTKY